MKAKITLGKMQDAAFTTAMQSLLAEKLPPKTAFKVKSLVMFFNDKLKVFNETRREILESHCKKGEDGKPLLDAKSNYQFDPEKLQEVSKELNELMSVEVEFVPLYINELGDQINVTAQQLFDLGDVIQ